MMNKKERIAILLKGVVLAGAGFGSLAATEALGTPIDIFFGVLGVALLLSAIIYLLKRLPKMMESEILEKAEKLEAEDNFFTRIGFRESVESLTEKFLNAGFKFKDNRLYKKSRSIFTDFRNYHVIIMRDINISEYLVSFSERMNDFLGKNKNNYVFLVFFQSNITIDEVLVLKSLYITQEAIQEIPNAFSETLVPIAYDIGRQEYVIRMNKSKLLLKHIHIATRFFCKKVFNNPH
jgi:hypothetical protein